MAPHEEKDFYFLEKLFFFTDLSYFAFLYSEDILIGKISVEKVG
jgi:hypothetical protein